MTTPITLPDIRERVLIVKFETRRPRSSRKDNNATHIVEASAQVEDVGFFNKKLFKKSARFNRVKDSINAAYRYHKSKTVPSMTKGEDMLLVDTFLGEYTSAVNVFRADTDKAVRDFDYHYAQEVVDDMARLGSLANPDDYPASVSDLGFTITPRPMATNESWLFDMPEDAQKALDEAMAEMERNVTSTLIKRMVDPVRRLIGKLDDFKGDEKQRWHHTMVTTTLELTNDLSKLNIYGDTSVDSLLKDLKAALTPFAFAPEMMKESQQARDNAKKALEDVLGKFGL
jgi:hypothetical protein